MKLVVGLGNPGEKYTKTRHNIGFAIINQLAKKHNQKFKVKNQASYFLHEEVIYLKPEKMMNNSGDVVSEFIHFFKIKISDIIIIYDDKDINFGQLKLKGKGSSGGHNGVKSIINHLKTEIFLRLKVGVNSEFNFDTQKFVMSNFSKEEEIQLPPLLSTIIIIIEEWVKNNDQLKLMNQYN